jgi:hypothetical protein
LLGKHRRKPSLSNSKFRKGGSIGHRQNQTLRWGR